MITWLHGPYGAGKSSVAAEAARRRPDLVPYDPELVGYVLRQALPLPTGDFQDLPEWRELVVATGAALDAGGRRSLVTPMTLLEQRYADEVFTGLADRDVRVVHVLLDVAEAELRPRIVDAAAETGARQWRLDRVTAYAQARSWLVPLADVVVDTTALPVAEVADRVLAVVDAHPARR